MKLFRKSIRLFTFTLALHVLLAQVGLAVNIHTCMISGKSSISLAYIQDCCAPVNADAELLEWLKSTGCCTSEADFQNVENETSPDFTKVQLTAAQWMLLYTVLLPEPQNIQVANQGALNSNHVYSLIKPTGPALLTLNQTFII